MNDTNGFTQNRWIKPIIGSLRTFLWGFLQPVHQAPFIRDAIDMKRYMICVVLAALPTALAGIYLYGWRVLAIIVVSYTCGVLTEAVFAAVRRQDEIHEGAFVTCLLYALILPPTIPLWIAAVGIVFGTIFGKEVFGGTGKNIFNPAMAGRIFISFAFPDTMTKYWIAPAGELFPAGFDRWLGDAVSGATPLTLFQSTKTIFAYSDLFWGDIAGCIGETVKPLVLLGGLFLMITRIADWRIPVSYLISAWCTAFMFHAVNGTACAPPLFHLLSGGLLFAAMFMVADPVTSPFTLSGRWIAGIMLGIVTVVIRVCTGYAESVMFAVIIVNIFSPLIDQAVLTAKYGNRTYEF